MGLQMVHGDDLPPLAHLDSESLGPLGDHQGRGRHMGPPEASAGRQLAHTHDSPWLNEPAAC